MRNGFPDCFPDSVLACAAAYAPLAGAYGRPAYGAQAAAQAICSTKLLVRLMVRPGFTARTACAGLCGFFSVEILFSATQ